MKKTDRNALIALPLLITIGFLFALAGAQNGMKFAGLPVIYLAVGLAFLIQWIMFIPAYVKQTEKFFDLTGSFTYITVILLTLFLSKRFDSRSILVTALVIIWAIRLGTFLFGRIRKAGKDDRFDEIKPSFIRFLNVWTIQGLWVSFTMSAALIVISSSYQKDLDLFAVLGFAVWVLGFALEVIADAQKSRFSSNPGNKGKFIQTGLWSKSRHPNYFGEITLWVGIAIIALPVLHGWQWIALLSPVFVTILLTRVSGIPLLEEKADKKWGGQQNYEEYKKNTPVLIPKL